MNTVFIAAITEERRGVPETTITVHDTRDAVVGYLWESYKNKPFNNVGLRKHLEDFLTAEGLRKLDFLWGRKKISLEEAPVRQLGFKFY